MSTKDETPYIPRQAFAENRQVTGRAMSLYGTWLLPGCALAGVLLFDLNFMPGAMLTPTFTLLAMAFMGFFLEPVPMIVWAIAYSVAAVYTVYHPDIFMPGPRNYSQIYAIRTIGEVAAAVMAIGLCFHRTKGMRKGAQLDLLVREVPVPLVLSDVNGEIIFMNRLAAEMIGVELGMAEGNSYFTLLTDENKKGAFIQQYLGMFDATTPKKTSIELKPKNFGGKTLRGVLIAVDGRVGRSLITIISEEPVGAFKILEALA